MGGAEVEKRDMASRISKGELVAPDLLDTVLSLS